jgi:hypothetical protein
MKKFLLILLITLNSEAYIVTDLNGFKNPFDSIDVATDAESPYSQLGYIVGNIFVCPGSGSINISKIGTAALHGAAGARTYRMCIYTDVSGTPTTLIANSLTPEIATSDTGWHGVYTYVTMPVLTGGNSYWIFVWCGTGSTWRIAAHDQYTDGIYAPCTYSSTNNPSPGSWSVFGYDICVQAEYSAGTKQFNLTMAVSNGGTTTPSVGTHAVDTAAVTSISHTCATNYGFKSWHISSTAAHIADTTVNSTSVWLSGDATVTANDTFIPFDFLAIGNSICEGHPGYTGPEDGGPSGDTLSQIWVYLDTMGGQKLRFYNAGHGGQFMQEPGGEYGSIMPRLDSNLTKWQPRTTYLEGGINDIGEGGSYTLAGYITAIDSCRKLCAKHSSTMIMMQITPDHALSGKVQLWNAQMEYWAKQNNIQVAFDYQDMVDTDANDDTYMRTSYTVDSLHCTISGDRNLAKILYLPAVPGNFRWVGHPNYPASQYDSWRQWVGPKMVTGDADTGSQDLNTNDTLCSPVWCLDTSERYFVVTVNQKGSSTTYIRQSSSYFHRYDATPAWVSQENPTDISTSASGQYVQVKIKASGADTVYDVKTSFSNTAPCSGVFDTFLIKSKVVQCDTLRCNYLHIVDTAIFNKPVIVRDSIIYSTLSTISALSGSKIWSTPGYTLTIKLNGKTGTPTVVNKGSKIRWQ